MAPETEGRETVQTLEQQRARVAWTRVSEFVDAAGSSSKSTQDYRSVVRKIPAMIGMNGFGQTLAFLLSKEGQDARRLEPKKAEGRAYKNMENWLLSAASPVAWDTNKETLIERVVEEDSVVYRQATQEALSYVVWLKRFAEALVGKDTDHV
jgi:CRISPR-associated protein Cmr5